MPPEPIGETCKQTTCASRWSRPVAVVCLLAVWFLPPPPLFPRVAAQTAAPIATLATGPTTVPEIGALAFDPARSKLYVGVRRHAVDRLSLWVFDVSADGGPIGRPRKSPDSLAALTPSYSTWPTVLHLDPARRRLDLGVAESHHETVKTLGVEDLDEQGEPTGPGHWRCAAD